MLRPRPGEVPFDSVEELALSAKTRQPGWVGVRQMLSSKTPNQ